MLGCRWLHRQRRRVRGWQGRGLQAVGVLQGPRILHRQGRQVRGRRIKRDISYDKSRQNSSDTLTSDLVESIKSNKITRASAKLALDEVIKNGKQLSEIIEDLDLGHVSDETTLSDIITEVLDEEAKAVEDAKQNPDIVNFLVGKVMQKTRGKADPELTLSLLKKHLGIN